MLKQKAMEKLQSWKSNSKSQALLVSGARQVGKTIVFGLLKRGDKVYTQIVPDVSRKTLMQVINDKVSKESIMYTDGFRSYDGLVD